MVVLISGINFASYILVKIVGPEHGIGVTGLLGGLVSSTAVTLGFAQRSRAEPASSPALAVGILLAWTVRFARIVVMVTIISRPMAARIALVMGGLALVTVGIAYLLWFPGMGAYAGYAEGLSGFVANAASPAVREPFSVSTFEIDGSGSISIPISLFENSDFDNSGSLDFDYSNLCLRGALSGRHPADAVGCADQPAACAAAACRGARHPGACGRARRQHLARLLERGRPERLLPARSHCLRPQGRAVPGLRDTGAGDPAGPARNLLLSCVPKALNRAGE